MQYPGEKSGLVRNWFDELLPNQPPLRSEHAVPTTDTEDEANSVGAGEVGSKTSEESRELVKSALDQIDAVEDALRDLGAKLTNVMPRDG